MKIISWNINGLRAALDKGALDWLSDQHPDIVCFQEIKARPEQVKQEHPIFKRFTGFWNPAQRPGYSGVLTLAREKPLEIRYGLNNKYFDDEGRVVRTRHRNYWLYNIYFPNGQRGKERVIYKLEFYKYLLDECDKIQKRNEDIILTGDFNTAHREIDLANPAENQETSGFLPIERKGFEEYLEHGFIDVYRYIYPDKVQYTWWTYRFGARHRNIGWRIDYFLVSSMLINLVKDIQIFDHVKGSDHCPVVLELND